MEQVQPNSGFILKESFNRVFHFNGTRWNQPEKERTKQLEVAKDRIRIHSLFMFLWCGNSFFKKADQLSKVNIIPTALQDQRRERGAHRSRLYLFQPRIVVTQDMPV